MRANLPLILVILVASFAACSPTPSALPPSSAPVVGPVVPVGQPEIRDLGPSTETVWNCGSGGGTVVKHPSMSVATNWAVEWEVGSTAGTGVRIGDGVIPGGVDLSVSLEGHYANKFDQSIQQGTGWDLPAEPNTMVVYTLMWREVWQPGYVDVRLANQSVVRVNVRYRTGIQSEIVGKQQQSCGAGQQTSQPTPIPTQPISVPTTSYGSETSGNLTPCSSFQSGETRRVFPGTFVIGDITIDGIAQYDSGGTGEGTVAYFEREATVTAQWGAGCYLGSRDLADEVIQGEFQHGCGSRCTSVRFVLVQSDGQQQVQYYNR